MGDDNVTLGEVSRQIKALDERVGKVLGDHEKRLRAIERWMYAVPATVISSLAALAVAVWGR